MSPEERIKLVSEGYCEHHAEFADKLNKLIELQENKMMDVWKITKSELIESMVDNQKAVLQHLGELKNMVFNFLSSTAKSTERHDKEIEKLQKRMLQLEVKYHKARQEEGKSDK